MRRPLIGLILTVAAFSMACERKPGSTNDKVDPPEADGKTSSARVTYETDAPARLERLDGALDEFEVGCPTEGAEGCVRARDDLRKALTSVLAEDDPGRVLGSVLLGFGGARMTSSELAERLDVVLEHERVAALDAGAVATSSARALEMARKAPAQELANSARLVAWIATRAGDDEGLVEAFVSREDAAGREALAPWLFSTPSERALDVLEDAWDASSSSATLRERAVRALLVPKEWPDEVAGRICSSARNQLEGGDASRVGVWSSVLSRCSDSESAAALDMALNERFERRSVDAALAREWSNNPCTSETTRESARRDCALVRRVLDRMIEDEHVPQDAQLDALEALARGWPGEASYDVVKRALRSPHERVRARAGELIAAP